MTRSQRLYALLLAVAIWAIGLGTAILSAERPTGTIVGRVAASDGSPISGAKVLLYGENGRSRFVMTAEDGSFRADRLPAQSYRIQARKRGYDAQWHEPEIPVEENKVASDVAFALMPRDPSVYFSHYQRVFLPKEKIRITTRGSLVDDMELALYRLDAGAVLRKRGHMGNLTRWGSDDREYTTDPDAALPPEIPQSALTPVGTWSATVPRSAVDEDDWFYRPVEVPQQGEGTFLLTLSATDRGKTLRDAYWFNVTRLALVTKRSRDQLLVYASDFETRKPVPDAALQVFSGTSLVAAGRTDRDGIWLVPYAQSGQYVEIAGRAGASFASVAAYHGESKRLSVLTYTDRPIYRPGHKVQFKGIVRDTRGAGPTIPPITIVSIWVRDPDGGTVYKRDAPVSAMGTYHGDFMVPEDGHTGDYSLVTDISGDRYYHTFEVQAYRKPEFKVDVRPAALRVVGGDPLDVSVNATYYFGAPVTGARVRYMVFARTEYPGWSEDDAFYGGFAFGEDESPSGGEIVLEGEGTTDDAGHLQIPIATAKIEASGAHEQTYDRRYVVEVESQDQSRRLVKGKASFLVTRGLFNLKSEIATYLVQTGQPVRVAISARDYDGKPIVAATRVSLVRETYVPPSTDEDYGTTQYETVGTQTVTTDAQGDSVVTVEAPTGGSYTVEIEATDAKGNVIGARGWFWASAEDTGGTERYGSLGVTFDKKTYKAGDTAKVLITSPVPDLPLLVTYESYRIHTARVVRLRGSTARLDIPVTRAFEPNVWIDVTAVNRKELLSTGRSLNVLPAEKFLTVEIVPDKEKYLPGANATFKVKARSAGGKPVPDAEISLGVVDEAIYALAPDRTPDLRRFFLGPKSSEISTSHSFSTDYSAGPAKDLGDVRIRKNFQDTAAWYPVLRTGADGSAAVRFTLPDNLTTWVCTARAVTSDTRVGAVTRNVLATKDLLVRLETPRFFTQGDELRLAAMTHNYTESAQDVRVAFEADGLKIAGPREFTAQIAPGSVYRADMPVSAEQPGMVSIQVVAGNRTANDGMALEVPILPFGIPDARTWAGQVETTPASPAGHAQFDVTVPRDAIDKTVALEVSLSPSPWAILLGGIRYLQNYSYWCTEQTTSRIVPYAEVYAQLPADDPRRAAMRPDIEKAVRHLLGMRHSDGWGWWEGGDAEVALTAYALWGVTTARAYGFEAPDAALEGGLAYLAKALPPIQKDTPHRHYIEADSGADTRAVGLWGMWNALERRPGGLTRPPQVARRTAEAELDRLWRARAQLTAFGKALLAETLALADRTRAHKALSELDQEVKESANLAHWEARGGLFSWFDNDVETTAHALLAHLALDPAHPLVAKTERWLEMNRRHDKWSSTKDTAAALAAIAAFNRTLGDAGGGLIPVEVSLDGTPIASGTADPGPSGGQLAFKFAGRTLPPGSHRLAITASTQSRQLMYSSELRYFERVARIPARPGKLVKISRDYFGIPKDYLAEARTMQPADLFAEKAFKRLVPIKGEVRPGDRLVVRVQVETTQAVRFAIIEDPLPSGAEVLLDESGPSYWWNHRDVFDDRVVFFADTLTPDKPHAFYYVIRPEMLGNFRVLPPRVEAMYAPDIRANGAETRLVVKE
jgi:uncharacterized protein YfaS (alpha-2-macroglobulin family)